MSAVYTYKDLQDQVLAYLDESGTTGTSLTLTKNFLNQAHQMRLAMEPWPFLVWDSAEVLTCSTSTRFYALHQEFWRPLYFFNRTTKSYLIEVPARQLADTQARWNDEVGHPSNFRMASRSPVAAQPSASSVLTIVSTSASDNTSAYAITVKGVTANGVTTETITPNGTTPAPSTNAFTKILSVTKTLAWNGSMTMTSNSAAVTNLYLFPTEYGRSYQQLELLVTPSAADVIEYRFFRMPLTLVNDYDIPDIPPPHSQILVWDALLLFAGYLTDISSKSLSAWTDMQHKMEIQLAETFLEGQSVESAPRYVRYIEGESAQPRIFTS